MEWGQKMNFYQVRKMKNLNIIFLPIVLLAIIFTYAAQAAPEDSGFFNELFRSETHAMKGKGPSTRISYDYTQFPARAVQNKGTDIRVRRQNISAYEAVSESENSKFAIAPSLSADEYDTTSHIPVTNESVPSTLWNPSVTAVYSHTYDKDSLSTAFTISSPSNRPYANWDVLGLNSHLVYRTPSGDKNQWLLMAQWSNTRNYLNWIPLPGVAYLWNQSDSFKAVIGIPFLGIWVSPFDKFSISAFFSVLSFAHVRAEYAINMMTKIYTQYRVDTKSYMLFDRDNIKDRLFNEETTLSGGIIFPVKKMASLDLGGGYAFKRRMFIDSRYSKKDHTRELDFDPAGYGQLKLSMAF